MAATTVGQPNSSRVNSSELGQTFPGTGYELVIGDEPWDVDYFLHENPDLTHYGCDAEALLTADYDAGMLAQRARHRRVWDRSIFVGNPDDVLDLPFGPGLPGIRDWTDRLVIVGSADRCQNPLRGPRLADITGGDLVVIDGAGHLPQARDPVKVNLLLRDFVRRVGQK